MPKDNSFNTRGRGSYATQACNICRAKKIKCDGAKPACSSCEASGRNGECSWDRDVPVRKPRSEAHFEALRKRADALQEYADRLEAMLAKCVCQDVSAHLPTLPERPVEASDFETDPRELDSDEEITAELCLDDRSGGLLHQGITAPMRFTRKITAEVAPVTQALEDSNASYVLLVDDSAGYDPNFDWSRYLPREVPLKRREHDKILDVSFKFFTMFSLRLVPSLFLRDMHRALSVPRNSRPPKTPHYSPMLHNALVAVAAVFSDDPRIRDPKARRYFITAAESYLKAECQKPDLSLVHAFGLIGEFYGDEGHQVLGDLYFGMSARLSQALGLKIDCAAWVKAGLMTKEEMLARNWAHWTIFSVDLCWTVYFGRDFCGPPVDRPDIPLPFVDKEFDLVPWYHAPANIPAQPNHLSLAFTATTSLFLIARRIIDVVNGLSKGAREDAANDHLITEIDLELNKWKSDLPSELDITLSSRGKSTPQRLMLHCMYWWCIMVLHRPFFNRRTRPLQAGDKGIDHVKLCKRAAENVMELFETWSSLYTLRYTPPTMLQVVFCAGTVFLLLALQATSSVRVANNSLATSISQAELCVQYLTEIGVTWRSAARTGDILRCLLEDRLKPILARRLSAVPPQIESAPPPNLALQQQQQQQLTRAIAHPPAPTYIPPPPPHAEWNQPLQTYLPADNSWLTQYSNFNGQAEMYEQNALEPHPAYGADDRNFADLDFLLPTMDPYASSEVWVDGVLRIRRSDLVLGPYTRM
ncbi:hypothetical protein B0H16DRAFT_1738664 [Mycena metata]|uniref:Zn(2)-C6 fungal-type domain-containing protein n=1 Tax=Mycena metata TaxID=1033252 RepID=A0AAD7HIV0_9AGAR|nr:hypothetical protein B0H16DRAFT_1738664 [Mycena metata]